MRAMFTHGARITCLPFAFVSVARTFPNSVTISGFQVAPSKIPEGNAVELSQRTPSGPSAIFNGGMPSLSITFVSNPVPPSISIFSSSVIRFNKSSTRSSMLNVLSKYGKLILFLSSFSLKLNDNNAVNINNIKSKISFFIFIPFFLCFI